MSWRPLLLSAGLAGGACTAFGVATPPSTEAPADASTDDVFVPIEPDQLDPGPVIPDPPDPRRVCVDGGSAFCDDFESDAAVPRGWASPYPNSAAIKLLPAMGQDASTGFEIALPGATGAQQLFLRNNHGSAPASWQYRLSFDAKVATKNETVHGPRLMTTAPGFAADAGTTNRLDLDVAFTANDVHIGFNTPACSKVRCGPSITQTIPRDGDWHRYDFEVDVVPGDTETRVYGEVRLLIDNQPVLKTPLPIPLSKAKTRATLFGVSSAPGTSKAALQLDNAYVDVINLP